MIWRFLGRGHPIFPTTKQAKDDISYHIAIENHMEPHHWTEKIADCFLAYCLPFYYGPHNIGAYFLEEAITPIDIFDIDDGEENTRAAMVMDLYRQRLPAITKARELVLTEYNLMNVVARHVNQRHEARKQPLNSYIENRHIYRKQNPLKAALDGILHVGYGKGEIFCSLENLGRKLFFLAIGNGIVEFVFISSMPTHETFPPILILPHKAFTKL